MKYVRTTRRYRRFTYGLVTITGREDTAVEDADIAALLAAADYAGEPLEISDTPTDEDTEPPLPDPLEQYRDEALDAAASAAISAERAEALGGTGMAIIEAGRLNDEVLSARFQRTSIFIPANHFMSALGAPTLNVRGGIWPVWLLDKALDEGVTVGFTVPREWATFDVVLRGCNILASAGDVVFKTLHGVRGDGDDVTAGFTSGANAKIAAGGLNIRQSVTLRTNLPADSTKSNIIRVSRLGTDAGDTLDNDYGFTGVELVAKTYVRIIPEVPEAPIPVDPTAGNYFRKAANANLAGLRVWQQAPPPASDATDETYVYWPLTDSATAQNFNTSTWSGGNKWSFMWSNRRNYGDAWNKKPNPLPSPAIRIGSQEVRCTYTTVARANAATQARIRYMLGNDAATYQAPWIAAGGVAGDFVTDAALRADPAAYADTDFVHGSATYKVMVDRVPLPAPRFVDGTHPELQLGVMLDYEVQDSRTPAETTAFLQAVAADLHGAGKQLYLYTNALNGPSQVWTGIDATNTPTILAAVDYLALMLWSGNREGSISASYAAQVAMLGAMTAALWTKVGLVFELGNPGTTLADAQWVHNKLREAGTTHPGAGINFWRNFAVQGGPGSTLTNQKIAAVVAP